MAEPRLQALPFDEAIAALQTRRDNPLPSDRWQEVSGEEHAIAFTVARSAGFDVLSDIHESLHKALSEGQTFESWKRDITPTLQQKGWWGRVVRSDGEIVQLGSPRRLKTIFDVNMRVSYMAGRWEQIRRAAEREAARGRVLYLRYIAVLDERTRAQHRRWHGTILPWDHPFWQQHFPPNGWLCRCSVMTVTERELARNGWSVSPDPQVTTRAWRNPVTGDVVDVPEGVDPGWQHHVGLAREVGLQAMAKLDRLPAAAGAAAARVVDQRVVVDDYATWALRWAEAVGVVEQSRAKEAAGLRQAGDARYRLRGRGEAKAIAALPSEVVGRLRGLGVEAESAAIWITDSDLIHLMRTAKTSATTAGGLPKAVPLEDVLRLGSHLANPEAIYWDHETGSVLFVFPSVTGVRPADLAKAAVQVNVRAKLPRPASAPPGPRRTVQRNQVVTAGWERRFDPPRYRRLDGEE